MRALLQCTLAAFVFSSQVARASTSWALDCDASALGQKESGSLPVDEELLHARFFVTENLVPKGDQTACYRKNVSDGVALLERHSGLALRSFDDVDSALERLSPRLVGLLYWTTLSYARTIPAMSVFRRLSAAKRFHRALDRMVKLDERFFFGAPHRTLASFLARAPGLFGGDKEAAAAHAKRAVALGPQFAPNLVNLAEVQVLSSAPKEVWERTLHDAMAVQSASHDDAGEQHAAVTRARQILDGAKVE